MAKRIISGPILARLSQIWAPIFLSYVLPVLAVKHFFQAIILCKLQEN